MHTMPNVQNMQNSLLLTERTSALWAVYGYFYIHHYMYVCTLYNYVVVLGGIIGIFIGSTCNFGCPFLYVTPNSGSPLVLIQSSCYVLKHSFHADPISCWQCFLLSNPGLCSRYGQQETFFPPQLWTKGSYPFFDAFDMCVELYSYVHCTFSVCIE